MLNADNWVLEDKQSLLPILKWQKTVNVVARVFGVPTGLIIQKTPIGFQPVVSSQTPHNPYRAGDGYIPADVNIFCRRVVETGDSLYVKDASLDSSWLNNPQYTTDGFASYCGLPIKWPNGEVFGTICILDFNTTNYADEYLELMSELRDLIEADLSLLNQYQLIADLSMKDELTSLYNRRGFMCVAGQRLALAKRSKQSGLGIMFLDMDGLKALNDIEGHHAGDDALKKLASVLQKTVQEGDIVARIGGDEFVVLMTINSASNLLEIEERLQKELTLSSLGVSIGSLVMDVEGMGLDDSLMIADERMYRAKKLKNM